MTVSIRVYVQKQGFFLQLVLRTRPLSSAALDEQHSESQENLQQYSVNHIMDHIHVGLFKADHYMETI